MFSGSPLPNLWVNCQKIVLSQCVCNTLTGTPGIQVALFLNYCPFRFTPGVCSELTDILYLVDGNELSNHVIEKIAIIIILHKPGKTRHYNL